MQILALVLAVVIGITLVFVVKPNKTTISLLLTFSGAYLLSITILKLFPEVYEHGGDRIGIYIILGLIIQLILDFFSKGVEHGHNHGHGVDNMRFPWALFISLNIHAFMEGLPLSDHHHNHLLWAIVIHKAPIAMVLASLFIHHKSNKTYAAILLIAFAFMTPLGTVLGGRIPFLVTYHTEINAVVAGNFLHIATIILFESSKEHRFNIYKFSALLVGIGLAIMV